MSKLMFVLVAVIVSQGYGTNGDALEDLYKAIVEANPDFQKALNMKIEGFAMLQHDFQELNSVMEARKAGLKDEAMETILVKDFLNSKAFAQKFVDYEEVQLKVVRTLFPKIDAAVEELKKN